MDDKRKAVYRKNGQDQSVLSVNCWCGCRTVKVPAADVARGVTASCGRRLCDALNYSQVLTAGGSPCDCRERA